VTDITAILEICGTVVLVAVPIIVLSWALAGSDGPSLADIFAVPAGPPLPRGVQEGEPVRYRVERLSRPRRSTRAVAPERQGRAARQVVETGPCATC
jgi:cell division septation protein DedD